MLNHKDLIELFKLVDKNKIENHLQYKYNIWFDLNHRTVDAKRAGFIEALEYINKQLIKHVKT